MHKTKGTSFYVTQPETVGAMKRIWLGSISDKAEPNGASVINALFEIDCPQNRVRFLQQDSYSADGDHIAAEPFDQPDKWYYPPPDVVAYTVVEMGCGRKPITGKGVESLKDALPSADAAAPGNGG